MGMVDPCTRKAIGKFYSEIEKIGTLNAFLKKKFKCFFEMPILKGLNIKKITKPKLNEFRVG